MPNVTELRRVQRHIRRYPELHNQGVWIRPTDCGTFACVAGRACLLNGWRPRGYVTVEKDGEVHDVDGVARVILGLEREDAIKLFDGFNTVAELHAIIDRLCEEAEG